MRLEKPFDFTQSSFVLGDCLLHIVGCMWWVGSLQAAISSVTVSVSDILAQVADEHKPDREKEFPFVSATISIGMCSKRRRNYVSTLG
jgi:hypothetical protein